MNITKTKFGAILLALMVLVTGGIGGVSAQSTLADYPGSTPFTDGTYDTSATTSSSVSNGDLTVNGTDWTSVTIDVSSVDEIEVTTNVASLTSADIPVKIVDSGASTTLKTADLASTGDHTQIVDVSTVDSVKVTYVGTDSSGTVTDGVVNTLTVVDTASSSGGGFFSNNGTLILVLVLVGGAIYISSRD